MEEDIKENGLTITWKELEFTHGKMEDVMKVNIRMIKNKVMESIHGLI